MKTFFVLILAFFYYSIESVAQVVDNNNSIKDSYTSYIETDIFFNLPAINVDQIDTFFIDTTLSSVHEILIRDSLISYQYLGVPGMPLRNLNCVDENVDLVRQHGYNYYTEYFNHSKKLIRTNKRFSNLKYGLGSAKEQYLDVIHSQNITSGLNFTIKYERISSEGFLRRQNTRHSNLEIYPWYNSKSNKYSGFLHLSLKNFNIQENGGIGSDSITLNNNDLNLLSINLPGAENEFRNSSGELIQRIGFVKLKTDTFSFKHSFVHRLRISDEKNIYRDTDPELDFYPTIYYDSTVTNDVLKINRLNNIFLYQFSSQFTSNVSLYITNDYMKIEQRSLDTILNSHYTGLKYQQKVNYFGLDFKGEYCFSGTNTEDFMVNSTINYTFYKNYIFSLGYLKKMSSPEFIYTVFQSNNFAWYKRFEKINSNQLTFEAQAKSIKSHLAVNYYIINNYTYFNEFSQPEQFTKSIEKLAIQLKNTIVLGKFGLISKLIYNKVSDERIIKLPEISISETFFYENHLFGKALFTRIGLELNYMSAFDGDKYMPALRQFYLQDEVEVAGYPQINLFINFKIKTARVFLMVEDLFSGVQEDFYYTTPNYPMPGRVFRFGLNWMFFD